MRQATDSDKMVSCNVCGKTLPMGGAYDFYYKARTSKDDRGKLVVFCSERCKDDYVLPCKECHKETRWGDTSHHHESWAGCPEIPGGVDHRDLWCSDECYEKYKEREKKCRRRGDSSLRVLVWGLPILAVLGALFGFWFCYPNFFAPLLYIIPIYAIIVVVSGLLIGRNSNKTPSLTMLWLICFAIPFGGICLLSVIILLVASIYVGLPAVIG